MKLPNDIAGEGLLGNTTCSIGMLGTLQVRDREDAIASTRVACAPQTLSALRFSGILAQNEDAAIVGRNWVTGY